MNKSPALVHGFYIGTSGFVYKDWGKGVFYPTGLPNTERLAYYARLFNTVELNTTFYHLPRPESVQRWHEQTPDDFSFAIKGSQFITHTTRLKDPAGSIDLFFQRAKFLKEKLKVVLWQFPSSFQADPARLAEFVNELEKRSTARQAFEFRHASWFSLDVFRILSNANMALCHADWPSLSEALVSTADFVYLRRHGTDAKKRYNGSYTDQALKKDAQRLQQWKKEGKDVFLYFNNDYEGHALKNALTVKKYLSTHQT